MPDAPASPAPGGGVAASRPQAEAPNVIKDVPSQPDSGLSPDEERQLGELLAKRDKAGGVATVRLRVEGAHQSIRVGHTEVGRDWTEVPEHMVTALEQGAADAGVTLTQEEG